MRPVARGLRIAFVLLGTLAAGLTLFWFWLAIGVQLQGVVKLGALAALLAAAIAAVVSLLRMRTRGVWLIAGLGVVIGWLWWSFLPATNDRPWAPELAHVGTGEVNGSQVTLHDVRNFNWTTTEQGVASWETRVVDADSITSVDLFTSVWGSPLIAHVMISFGFADGQHVVFSNEIRRTQDQVYSTLGGFVREFTLIQIMADERDVIHLRTDLRGETVSLFPLQLPPAARKALFLGFVNFGNDLAARPRWYNTLLANCTTMPYRIVDGLGGRLPLDWRILASGYLPQYLYDRGYIRPDLSVPEVLARARLPKSGPLPPDGVTYSRSIRAAWAN
jgi:hypothetical protein